MKRIMVATALALTLVLSFPTTAMAGGMLEGKVILGQNFTLASGETLYGDLLVLGGNVRLEPESRITGDVAVLGGNVDSSGEIDGDIVLLGGNVDLRAQALVRGDIFILGGNIRQEEGAVIEGRALSGNEFDVPFDLRWGAFRVVPIRFWSNFAQLKPLMYLFRSLMMGALAVLVVMFWPEPSKRVGQAATGQALIAGGMGLLTLLIAPAILFFLAITVVLIPIALLFVLALAIGVVFGWSAIGLEVGQRLALVLKWDLHPAAAGGLGTFLFSLVIGGIGFIPCFGWLAPLVVILLSIGAVILTRFGTQSYNFKATSPSGTEVIDMGATSAEETQNE